MDKLLAAALLLLVSCGDLADYRQYYVSVHPENDGPAVSVAALAQGVEILGYEFEHANIGMASLPGFAIRGVRPQIVTAPLPFACGLSGLVASKTLGDGKIITLGVDDTGCAPGWPHEVTHVVLAKLGYDDPDHKLQAWWRIADGVATDRFIAEACQ